MAALKFNIKFCPMLLKKKKRKKNHKKLVAKSANQESSFQFFFSIALEIYKTCRMSKKRMFPRCGKMKK